MKAAEGRRIAAAWVNSNAEAMPGFRGAFFSGSIVDLADEAELAPTSDVDVLVVLDGAEPPEKPGKIVAGSVVLEVTYLPWAEVRDTERVATTFYLAPSFRRDTIISDPTGHLRSVQRNVARSFDEPAATRKRCQNVVDRLRSGQEALERARTAPARPPFEDLLLGWLFPASLPAVAILVAARQNPTVRRRYSDARAVLADRGLDQFHERLLRLIGCEGVSAQQAGDQLAALAGVFDAAAAAEGPRFAYSSDITAHGRGIAIDGTAELIAIGHHREAVFWLMVTFARCLHILRASGADLTAHDEALRAAATNLLGVGDLTEIGNRASLLPLFLPALRDVVEIIVDG